MTEQRPAADAPIGRRIRRGLAWGTVNSMTLRLGSLLTGIALARLLSPEDFGVYAVALTIQLVLVNLADLGLSADLVRSDDPDRRAPTVATLSLATSAVLAAAMALSAGPMSQWFGSPDAAPVIAVLSLSIVFSGAGVAPFARLTRDFQQRRLFVVSVADFTVGTVVTIVLVLVGLGPMALAVARLASQAVATTLMFVLAGLRPRFGLDRRIARSALAFGLPLAGANVLSWTLLNVDTLVVSRVAGAVSLGLYVLAFNVSSWPMTAIGQAVRSVALAAFSRLSHGRRDPTLAQATALAWAAALPFGVMLAALGSAVIVTLYGSTWQDAAPALAALGIFGALRVVFDLMASYLAARGAPGAVLRIQVLWIVVLIPSLMIGVQQGGIAGAGWAHVGVAVIVVLPAYLMTARRVGADLGAMLPALVAPIVGAIPAGLAAWVVAGAMPNTVVALLVGGLAGATAYLGLIGWWLLPLVRQALAAGGPAVEERVEVDVDPLAGGRTDPVEADLVLRESR